MRQFSLTREGATTAWANAMRATGQPGKGGIVSLVPHRRKARPQLYVDKVVVVLAINADRKRRGYKGPALKDPEELEGLEDLLAPDHPILREAVGKGDKPPTLQMPRSLQTDGYTFRVRMERITSRPNVAPDADEHDPDVPHKGAAGRAHFEAGAAGTYDPSSVTPGCTDPVLAIDPGQIKALQTDTGMAFTKKDWYNPTRHNRQNIRRRRQLRKKKKRDKKADAK